MFNLSREILEKIKEQIKKNNLKPVFVDNVNYFCILCSGGVADGCSNSCNNSCSGDCTGSSSCAFN